MEQVKGGITGPGAWKAEHRAKEDNSSNMRFGLWETRPIVSSLQCLLFGTGLSVLTFPTAVF